MNLPALKARCPRCSMTNHIPLDQVRIVELGIRDRIRFDCDDCGMVTRPIPFAKVAELVAAGMPASLTDDDWIGFQIAMAWRDDLADLAELEGASS